MPKGVEHVRADAYERMPVAVSSSVMPKGVEHTIPQATKTTRNARVEFSDAERR